MSWVKHVEGMTDSELLAGLGEMVGKSRRAVAGMVAHLAEVDRRRLYLGRGCSSLFGYCTEVLHMSEGAAYMRISTARAARKHPVLIEMLADGRLHVSGIARLAAHLTTENRDEVLARAVHRTKRQVEELVAELAPQPDAPTLIRRLSTRGPQVPSPELALFQTALASKSSPAPALAPAPAVESKSSPSLALENVPALATANATSTATVRTNPTIEALAPDRYKIQLTASAALKTKLDRLRDEMRHQVPDGDLATLLEIVVSEKLAAIEKRRYARAQSPRKKSANKTVEQPRSRYIPADVRRAVRERDGDQCTFVGEDGRPCTERGALELHHEDPYARGGAHTVENVRLLCRAHNQWLGECAYGKAAMRRFRSKAGERSVIYVSGEVCRRAIRWRTTRPTQSRTRWLVTGLAVAAMQWTATPCRTRS